MIRIAKKNDLVKVNDLFKEMLFAVTGNPNQEGYTDNYLNKFVIGSGDIIFLAIEENEIVGFISIELHRDNPPFIYLDDFCVTANYRHKGIGTSLLKEAIEYTKENNINKIYLHVEKDNQKAFTFYKNLGFLIAEETNNRLKLCLSL